MPDQVERDGFTSQLELAISSGTVDPQIALGQTFTRSLGPDGFSSMQAWSCARCGLNVTSSDTPRDQSSNDVFGVSSILRRHVSAKS